VAELEAIISKEHTTFLKASEDQKLRFDETEARIQSMIESAKLENTSNRDKIIADLHEVTGAGVKCCLDRPGGAFRRFGWGT
jgi:hypothetical protein